MKPIRSWSSWTQVLAAALVVGLLGAPYALSVVLTDIRVNGDVVSTANPLPITGSVSTGGSVVGNGTAATASRVTIASDSTGTVAATQSGTWTVTPAVVGNGTAATAQRVTVANDSTGVITTTPSNVGNGTAAAAQRVTLANDSTGIVASTSTGNVAAGSADSGSPVKVGCKYNATLPTYGDLQRTDCQTGTRGSLHVELWGSDSASAVSTLPDNVDGTAVSTNNNRIVVVARPGFFNGTTWDRAFTCTNTVAVTVAAGTTQIVALSGSTVIRVCNYSLSMAAAGAGTVKFVYGTGSNCGTGTTDISAAMPLVASGNMTASAAAGASLLRGLAANALCLTVATNTVTGYVTYAQF